MTPISSPSLSALKNMPNNLLQDNNTNNTTNSLTLMKQTGGGVPSNETPPSAAPDTNVGALGENKDLNFENICPPAATAPMRVEEEEVMVPTTGEEKEKELAEEMNANACLLYTSPSPRDRQKSRMPSSA